MGPFPIVIRQLKFLVVNIDYFTKWVEVKALATITKKNVRKFIWRNIICRRRSLESQSQITENNSTMTRSKIFAHNWKSRIITPHPPTFRPMDKLRSRTDSCLRSSRLYLRGQRVYGQKSFQVYYGHIGRRTGYLQERCRFDMHTGARPSSQLRSDSQATEWRTMMRIGTTKPCTYNLT